MGNIAILGIIIAVIIGLIILAFVAKFFNLWLQALFSKAGVSMFQLIGMRLRKVPPKIIVDARILSCKAGMPVDTNLLEAHYMSGGNVLRVIQALIAANKANIKLDFKQAAAIDLAGRNVLEAVQMSVNPKVIETPRVSAVALDGIQLHAVARITVRASIQKLVGGAGEETVVDVHVVVAGGLESIGVHRLGDAQDDRLRDIESHGIPARPPHQRTPLVVRRRDRRLIEQARGAPSDGGLVRAVKPAQVDEHALVVVGDPDALPAFLAGSELDARIFREGL